MAWQVTIDNGSTFTDGCLLADDVLKIVKVLTTPYDLMRCFAEVFRELAKAAGLPNEAELLKRVEEVRYSTTSGTNALLVRKGVRVGAIIGKDAVADLYGLRKRSGELVDALVGDRVAGIDLGEASGEELDNRIVRAVRDLLALGSQWIVVSLPEPSGAAGEREFKLRYMKLLPGHLLGSIPVLFSRELCADPDDERRTATAILNGFLHREMARFLYHADAWIRDRHVVQPLRIMRNDGGCGRVAKTTAVKTLDSGPMGGLSGAAALARLRKIDRMVTVDVGGTSTDIGVIESEEPVVELFGSAQGLPLSFPFPALHTAALGGGSLFRVEKGGIRIGPDSAGALPGPACFGRGGEHPTLTDAALVAGYIDAGRFAGGSIVLRPELAANAIEERIARPLGLKNAAAGAWAMIDAFADGVAEAVRDVLRRHAWSPAETVLSVFGGSGPLLSCMVGERIGLKSLIIPPASAGFSALGVSFAPLSHEYRALLDTPVAIETWNESVTGLRQRSERDLYGEGLGLDRCDSTMVVRDAKDGSASAVGDSGEMPSALAARNGHVALDCRVSVRGSGRTSFLTTEPGESAKASGARSVLLDRETTSVPVVDAGAFRTGMSGAGPCLLESAYWTALLPKSWKWRASELGIELTR